MATPCPHSFCMWAPWAAVAASRGSSLRRRRRHRRLRSLTCRPRSASDLTTGPMHEAISAGLTAAVLRTARRDRRVRARTTRSMPSTPPAPSPVGTPRGFRYQRQRGDLKVAKGRRGQNLHRSDGQPQITRSTSRWSPPCRSSGSLHEVEHREGPPVDLVEVLGECGVNLSGAGVPEVEDDLAKCDEVV